MLTYHPLKDPNHCIFRMLCILNDIDAEEIPIDLLKILDFYLLFPHLLKKIKPFPNIFTAFKKDLNVVQDPFENLPSATKLLFDLSPIQETCINFLAVKKIINIDRLKKDKINLIKENIDELLLDYINKASFKNENWYSFLIKHLSTMSLYGENGLKARTKLMEYKYDSV